MNQFTNLTAALIKMMFKEDVAAIPDGKFPEGSEPFIVLARMRQLVEEKKINTAENMLFDMFDKAKPYYVRIGLEFYNRISQLSDEELEAADFSVEEIGEGIKDMLDFYGVKIAVKRAPQPAPANNPNAAPNVMADKPNPAANVMADKSKNKI